MNIDRFIDTLEKAYRTMWQIWCTGEAPRDFEV
jgi:hypothetical protein